MSRKNIYPILDFTPEFFSYDQLNNLVSFPWNISSEAIGIYKHGFQKEYLKQSSTQDITKCHYSGLSELEKYYETNTLDNIK